MFVTIEYQDKAESMLDDWDETIRCITSHEVIKSRLILLVTKFDRCDEMFAKQAQDNINSLFIGEEEISDVIFSHKEI